LGRGRLAARKRVFRVGKWAQEMAEEAGGRGEILDGWVVWLEGGGGGGWRGRRGGQRGGREG
jgi:hypothetical protein